MTSTEPEFRSALTLASMSPSPRPSHVPSVVVLLMKTADLALPTTGVDISDQFAHLIPSTDASKYSVPENEPQAATRTDPPPIGMSVTDPVPEIVPLAIS